MTADPVQSASDPGRDPAAIRRMLPLARRADFERSFTEALEQARQTYTLAPVDEVLERWRRIVVLSGAPAHAQALEHTRRLLDGEDAPTVPANLDALRG
jgi:hypothetical protein